MLLYFRGFRQNAAYHVLSAHRLHLRHLLHTGSGCIFTAVCKLTALGQIGRVRHQSIDGLETLYLLYQVRDGCHQSLGVGMADILVNLAECTVFHDFPGIHNRHIITGLCHNTQVMGNSNIEVLSLFFRF